MTTLAAVLSIVASAMTIYLRWIEFRDKKKR